MTNTIKLLMALCISAVLLFAFTTKRIEKENEVEAVKELVLNAYINGAFNKLDAESMAAGFHKDFAIFSPDGEEISKYPIDQWVEGVKKRRANDYDPKEDKNVWDHKFASVDVTGNAAQVKVELFNRGKRVYSDYLSLLKFDSGWKIVAKVYHKH